MRRFLVFLPFVFTTFSALGQNLIPAFPGAEGFGRHATGGRGGTVYHVTTLEDGDEPGTFRYAVSQKGRRTVVFDLAGTIFLNSRLHIVNGDLTIAGQTAPGQGICVAGYPVSVNSDNVIVRYLRFRVGNEGGGEPDGFGGSENRNLIIDHCSISWSVDETCTFYGGENVTVQWCLISESLRTAGHSKGKHGYGAIVGGHRSSFHHNLMAHHESRMPRLGPHVSTQEREYVDMRNNVFYNWAGAGCYGGEGMHVNIVNNYYKPGPATPKNSPVAYRIAAIGVRTSQYVTGRNGQPNRWKPMEHIWGRFYVDGNVVEGNEEVTKDNWSKGIYGQIDNNNDNTFTEQVKKEMRLATPLETDLITTHTAEEAYRLVLQYAGCSKQRDIIDTRIAEETKNGTATYFGSISSDARKFPGLIDVPNDVKPTGAASAWPDLSDGGVNPGYLKDSDGDGMPDWWETSNKLNLNDASDGKTVTLSKTGYTNLEMYLNGLLEATDPNFDAVVDLSGSGNYTSVQEAVDGAPENRTSPWVIFIKNGSYKETVFIPENKPFIHLIGQNKEKTIIHEKLHVGSWPPSDSRWYKNDSAAWPFSIKNPQSPAYGKQETVVKIDATDFYAENISFLNDFGVDAQTGPQALTLSVNNDRAAFYNCIIRSFQDTWMTSTNDTHRLYVKNCFIEGAVDYFYGGGDALLEECTFYNVRSGSVIVAPKQMSAKYGYVFRNCIVDGNRAAADGKQKLGRPWHNSPKAVFINTTMHIPIAPEGWSDMGAVPDLFAEYESRNRNGNLLSLANRKTFYNGRDGVSGKCRSIITKDEAQWMVYENIIPGKDGWDPRQIIKSHMP